MDKAVVLAVAGSGKTTHLISSLDLERRVLLVTYTDANYENLRSKIVARFGHVPSNISLYTYFSFLHGFCYRPFLRSAKNSRGIVFSNKPLPRLDASNDRRYMTTDGRLYAARLASFVKKEGLIDDVRLRLEKYFDAFYVDEVQDFAGHDFNFLIDLSAAALDMTFVGDFYQHTYDTSADGNVNKSLHDDYRKYTTRFTAAGMRVDTTTLQTSRRCSATVCGFITDQLGIAITSHSGTATRVGYEEDPAAVQRLYEDASTVKLFYQEHYKYRCYSQNWGASKGSDHYEDVCVVLSASNVKALQTGKLRDINVGTRNKLYVACSRARGNLTFISEAALKTHKVDQLRP
jgi:DNA helicase-2/ATP-dependent DNA helicase PcrA